MRLRTPLTSLCALLALLSLGCGDFVAHEREDGAAAEVTAEKPAGWESLEDEGSATRLYYQFVDERRQVRFVETLEEVPEALRAGVGFVKMDVPPPLSPSDAARAREAQRGRGATLAAAAAPSGGIVLYSAEWCGACKKAKRWLASNDVDYEVRDIDDPRWAQELLKKTGRRAIPVLDVDGRIMTGFSARGYEKLIERG